MSGMVSKTSSVKFDNKPTTKSYEVEDASLLEVEEASTSAVYSDPAKLAQVENVSAHNMYLGAERPSNESIFSFSLSCDDEEGNETDSDSSSAPASRRKVEDETEFGNLDRYGFIVVDSNSSSSSFNEGSESDRQRREQQKQEKHGKREAKRAIKWVEMLRVLEEYPKVRDWPSGHRKFESRLQKGIPECVRTKIWPFFLGITPSSSQPNTKYRELFLKISGFERQIDLDIERTLRDHILFKARFSSAQVSLFKILVAYSNYDPEVGYCQGMSTIAAFLLLYFEEELAFNMLVHLMRRSELRTLFTAGFPLLFECFHVQEQLMKRLCPELLDRLESFHITSSVYATKWYLTLFLGFPFSLATQLWDLFLFYDLDFLVCISTALLKIHEDTLLLMDYENCMQFLSKLPEMPIDEKRLIRTTCKIWRKLCLRSNDHTSPLKQLRAQYGKQKSSS